jgi:hypothetical protein
VRALRERFDQPVHLHTHDTTGGQLATLLAAVHAGVDAVDCAAAPFSGGTSQPNLSALVAATDHTERATGLDLAALSAMEPFWEAVRDLYAPFEAGLRAPTGTVYRHEIPGGQLTNLRQQAISLGLGDRWPQVQELYAVANDLLGKPIKVTPTSKVVGDLALFLAGSDVDPEALRKDPRGYDLPDSVLGYLGGELGTPPAASPSRSAAAPSRAAPGRRRGAADTGAARVAGGTGPPDRAVAAAVPQAVRRVRKAVDKWGDVSVIPTEAFWYGLRPGHRLKVEREPGVEVLVELETIGEPDEAGPAHAAPARQRPPRPITVRDRSAEVKSTAARRPTRRRPVTSARRSRRGDGEGGRGRHGQAGPAARRGGGDEDGVDRDEPARRHGDRARRRGREQRWRPGTCWSCSADRARPGPRPPRRFRLAGHLRVERREDARRVGLVRPHVQVVVDRHARLVTLHRSVEGPPSRTGRSPSVLRSWSASTAMYSAPSSSRPPSAVGP